jgi:hypothetical protein
MKGWLRKTARETERYKETWKEEIYEYYNRKVITLLRPEGRINMTRYSTKGVL